MDTDTGVHDVNVIIPPFFFNKTGSSGSIDGTASIGSVNLLTELMEKEPVTVLTLNAPDYSTHNLNSAMNLPAHQKNMRVTAAGYVLLDVKSDLKVSHSTRNS
ncbi:MAG: hypothetical protein OXF48_00295 [Bacteroidetes bacterium]|nr:hypothetical protein [Bacteroidota bacterium]